MLKKIKIRNLAIIDELDINFDPSFNVVTGESGAGKTIIYKSINYLFGKSFNKENIRKNESTCEILGLITINSDLHEIKRIFTKTTTKNFINGKIVNRNKYLDFIGESWESYGQHEQQLLLDENNHIIYIDLFSKNENALSVYQLSFNKYVLINNEIKKMINDNEDYSKNKELYEYQLKELENCSIDNDEDEILRKKIKEIEKSKDISDYLNRLTDISSSDMSTLLDTISNKLELISKKSSAIDNIIQRLNNLNYELSDIEYEASKLSKEYYYNQAEFEEYQKRLDLQAGLADL